MKAPTRKIRVLRIINRFNLGGPTFNVTYLTKYMNDDFETLLLGGEKDDSEASSDFILKTEGLNPSYIPNMRRSISPKNDLIAYKFIKKKIEEFKPDIVHTHASKAGTLGRLAAIHSGVPIVLHTFHGHVFHSYFGKAQTTFYKFIERYLAKNSSRIIAISKQQKKELGEIHEIANPNKIEIVPLGFDLSRFTESQNEKRSDFRERYKLAEDDVAVSIVGRLVPVKDHETFFKSIALLPDEIKRKARFFVVGDGELSNELRLICDELGLKYTNNEPPTAEYNICFTSWIKEVDEVVAGSDIIALTSLNEGTPVSLIEAQAGARAIVSTKVGGIQDIVIENESALLSEKQDPISFSNNLSRLISDGNLRAEMGLKGRNHVLKQYSYHRLVNDMETLYYKLLEEKQLTI